MVTTEFKILFFYSPFLDGILDKISRSLLHSLHGLFVAPFGVWALPPQQAENTSIITNVKNVI